MRFLIEILHISDCLDAATDFVGRSYKNAKKLEQVAEEFSWGKGSVYCPELVELLEEDKELQGDLRYLLGAGRIRTCYSIYGKAVDQNEIEEKRRYKRKRKIQYFYQPSIFGGWYFFTLF